MVYTCNVQWAGVHKLCQLQNWMEYIEFLYNPFHAFKLVKQINSHSHH